MIILITDFSKLRTNIQSAIDNITDMFSVLIERRTPKDIKRANLLSYWLKTYTHYTLSEDKFNPRSLIRYKRGNVVQVEFGYRVGKELGGRHYAVVIDNHNSFSSDTVTVVPLGSLKEKYIPNKYTLVLQVGLYDLMEQKIDKTREEIKNSLSQTSSEIESIKNSYKQGLMSFENYKKAISQKRKTIDECELQIDNLNRSMQQMLKLKKGTVANLGQVITISKMRISNPKIYSDSMYNVKLSTKDMDAINQKLKELYIYNDANA